jgi:hypothetical protein
MTGYDPFRCSGRPLPTDGEERQDGLCVRDVLRCDKINHIQKIWHAGLAMKDLGWV